MIRLSWRQEWYSKPLATSTARGPTSQSGRWLPTASTAVAVHTGEAVMQRPVWAKQELPVPALEWSQPRLSGLWYEAS